MVERPRAHPRYEVDAHVDVMGSDVLLYHRIQNISLGGICIQTPAVEEVGSVVDVVINFPDLGAQVALLGQIVWANRQPPKDVGIRWVDLDNERKELLRKYIALVKRREVPVEDNV
ncbi:MAG: PilZ domain-containing protein [Deltaproteobacteria bacterium]|nr:PilZ domain-containing protein [Deltaproteobacteria bacterium]